MKTFVPYCGLPPVPGHTIWNTDPVLGSALFVGLAIPLMAMKKRNVPSKDLWLFASGWAVLAFSLMSPLCNLSVALFSARVGQHLLISIVAAPLIAMSGVGFFIERGLFRGIKQTVTQHSLPLSPMVLVFWIVFWVWHFPGPYDLSLRNNVVYWVMQLSIIFASIGLWHSLLTRDADRGLQFVAGSLFTGLHMSLLGALLTFSGIEWFEVHRLTTWPWGLTPLDDQQMGGALMWVVGGVVMAFIVLHSFYKLFIVMEASSEAEPSS